VFVFVFVSVFVFVFVSVFVFVFGWRLVAGGWRRAGRVRAKALCRDARASAASGFVDGRRGSAAPASL
jgi:hypothetical protein